MYRLGTIEIIYTSLIFFIQRKSIFYEDQYKEHIQHEISVNIYNIKFTYFL